MSNNTRNSPNASTNTPRRGGGPNASTLTTSTAANNNNVTNSHTFKIVIIGDAGAGKTSLVKRFQFGVFQAGTRTTVGVEFAQKALVVDGNNVTVRMWDVAGQESTRNASRTYYSGAYGAFLVVDATNPLSMEATLKWKQDLDEKTMSSKYNLIGETNAGTPYPNNLRRLPCYLLLNKCDLGVSVGKTKQQLDAICARYGIQGYFETSAATGDGTNEAMEALVSSMIGAAAMAEANEISMLNDRNNNNGGNGRDSGSNNNGRIIINDKNLNKKDDGMCAKC